MSQIKKFVINLKRRPDRLEIFQKNCPFADIELVYGFDGKNQWAELSYREKNMLYKFPKLKPGEKGVFISHIRIFQKILHLGINNALIFEDDALFSNDFLNRFHTIEQSIPHDTSILYIGGRFEPEFKIEKCSKISDSIAKHITVPWIGDDMDRTLHAYIISKEMAELCLNEFYGSTCINEAIDSWILKVCIKNSLPIYNAYPLLCHSPLISNSDIR
jgi:GR25 family glycosyltransferase involved in LPS biosynthesis